MAKWYYFLPELFVGISFLSTEVEEYIFLSLYSQCSASHMWQVVGTQIFVEWKEQFIT